MPMDGFSRTENNPNYHNCEFWRDRGLGYICIPRYSYINVLVLLPKMRFILIDHQ